MNTFIRTKQHKLKEKKQHKNNNIQPNLHIHQTSGTPSQQLNTAAYYIVVNGINSNNYSKVNAISLHPV